MTSKLLKKNPVKVAEDTCNASLISGMNTPCKTWALISLKQQEHCKLSIIRSLPIIRHDLNIANTKPLTKFLSHRPIFREDIQ